MEPAFIDHTDAAGKMFIVFNKFVIPELLMPADPADKLIWHVREICDRIARGRLAAQNGSVRWQLVLRITSILLSSLGSVGVIADKASTNLPGESGWAFWGSVILLGFGILSQLASEFQVAKRAADSRSLAEKCELYDARLVRILNFDDPRTDASLLLEEVNNLFEDPQYNRVLPQTTPKMTHDATDRADYLIEHNQKHWQLVARRQKGVVGPRTARPSAAPQVPEVAPEPPMDPSGD